jgi:hypothetical protein
MNISGLRPDPANDPANAGPSGDALRGTLAENSDIVGPIELRGVSISDAEDCYIGVRRSEGNNNDFGSGTKHGRATAKFGQLMDTDRVTRMVFDSPAVGMQTLVFNPNEALSALSQDVIGPVEQAQIVTNGAERAIRRTQERLSDTGHQFVYFGVRDMDSDGLSHWHIYWGVDQNHVDGDSLDLLAGVESHVRNVPGATDADHPATEAVKWDPNPAQTVEAHGADMSHGGPVHPCARYVASSLPHLGSVGEMDSRAVRHGAIEWATTSESLKERKRDSLPVEIRRLSAGGSSR